MSRKRVDVSDEEIELLKKFRETKDAVASLPQPAEPVKDGISQLADALTLAIERTKPKEKITVANRKANTPWSPKDGEPVVKLKRKFYQHGVALDEKLYNAERALLNRVKPGRYCDGTVIVTLRKDRGIDISYPVRTAAQRLAIVNKFGIRSFEELLSRIIDEKTYPAKYRKVDDKDLYDFEDLN